MSLLSLLSSIATKLDSAALAGKDYLTQKEAAAYCGVSVAQFRAKSKEYGVGPFPFMGRSLYSKLSLRDLIRKEEARCKEGSPKHTSEAILSTSSGGKLEKMGKSSGSGCRSARFRRERQKLLGNENTLNSRKGARAKLPR